MSLPEDDILRIANAKYKYPLFVRQNTSDMAVYKEVIENKQYDFTTLQAPKVIVDAGGNIGLTAVYFARKYPNAKIITIEPEESNFAMLKKNTENYPNIIAINAALWNSEGEIELFDSGIGNWAFMTKDGTEHDDFTIPKIEKKHMVKTVTIESLLKDLARGGEDMIDVLKIDIEGAEKEVFNDCSIWIKNVRSVIVELHERYKEGCNKAFANLLEDFNCFSKSGENVFLSRDGFMNVYMKNIDSISLKSLYKNCLKRTVKKLIGRK
jgi:FkbM family methyltransferase